MTRLYIERGWLAGRRTTGENRGSERQRQERVRRHIIRPHSPPALPTPDPLLLFLLFSPPRLHNKAAGWENINLGMFCNLAARGVATYNGTLLLLHCYGVRTMFVSCLFLLVVVVVVVAVANVVVQIGGAHVCSPATKINISKVTKWQREDSSSRTLGAGTGVPRRGGACSRSIDTFLPVTGIFSAY